MSIFKGNQVESLNNYGDIITTKDDYIMSKMKK